MNFNPSELNLSTLPWVPLCATAGFPSQPGIYFAIDSQDTIQYIGRSGDVRQRWKNHHRYDELAAIGGVKIVYLSIEAPELLPEIEAALIEWFQPVLNRGKKASDRGAKSSRRNQKTINLSDKAMEEYELVASWKGIPVASLLRQVLEDHHESPTFGALVRRAKSERSDDEA